MTRKKENKKRIWQNNRWYRDAVTFFSGVNHPAEGYIWREEVHVIGKRETGGRKKPSSLWLVSVMYVAVSWGFVFVSEDGLVEKWQGTDETATVKGGLVLFMCHFFPLYHDNAMWALQLPGDCTDVFGLLDSLYQSPHNPSYLILHLLENPFILLTCKQWICQQLKFKVVHLNNGTLRFVLRLGNIF